jgi:D-alanyl-D-alanine carboxypeptidase
LSAITVRQLLNHTSGLADYFDEMVGDGQSFVEQMYADTHKLWQPVEILEWVKTHTRPQFTAGTRWSYTDTGFLVAGLLIEAVTGQPLHSVYRQRVFDPLGMAHTYLVFREDERPSIVGQREADAFIGDLNYTLPRTTSADWAGGGLVTTAADLQRFIRAAADARLFSRIETQAAMLSWIPTGEAGVYYGLGVRRFVPSELGEPDLGEVWGHSGALKSFMFYSPSLDATLCGTLNQAVTEGVWSDVRPIAPLMPATLRLLTTNAAR